MSKVVYTKKAKPKNIIFIVVVCVCILTYGKITNFFGTFTGETADDDRSINQNATEWVGETKKVTLPNAGIEVYIPAIDTLNVNSETTEQMLDFGNSAENELNMSLQLTFMDKALFTSRIFEPGKGITEAKSLGAIFKPDTYEATLTYTFYHMDGIRLKVLDTIDVPVTIVSEGSGDRWQEGQNTADKLDKKPQAAG